MEEGSAGDFKIGQLPYCADVIKSGFELQSSMKATHRACPTISLNIDANGRINEKLRFGLLGRTGYFCNSWLVDG
jgi:hypothetical protein